MNKTDELREELHKYLYKELAKVFETGTMQSRFDANNSEYHLPKIDLAIVPKILTEIDKYRDSAVEEERKKHNKEAQIIYDSAVEQQKEKDAEIVKPELIETESISGFDKQIICEIIQSAIREQ